MSYRAIKVQKDDELEVRVRPKKMFPYMEVAMLISEGYEIFVPELNRKTASYAKRVLSKSLNKDVLCFPASLRGEHGYVFKIAIFKEVLRNH
jgi:hypothetical protein